MMHQPSNDTISAMNRRTLVCACSAPAGPFGRCQTCYRWWKRNGTTDDSAQQCSTEGCVRVRFAKSKCNGCYQTQWARAKFHRTGEHDTVGRSLAHKPQGVRLRARIDASLGSDACHPWTGSHDENGYGLIRWNGRDRRVTNVLLEIEYGDDALDGGKLGCHTCDNPPCCNIRHLYVGTHRTNSADCWSRGRGSTPPVRAGVAHHSAELTEDQVRAMRQDRESGESLGVLSVRYAVSKPVVSKICRGEIWTHVDPDVVARLRQKPGKAKLTADAAREIRSLSDAGVPQTDLAERFGVCRPQISAVVNRRVWAHI